MASNIPIPDPAHNLTPLHAERFRYQSQSLFQYDLAISSRRPHAGAKASAEGAPGSIWSFRSALGIDPDLGISALSIGRLGVLGKAADEDRLLGSSKLAGLEDEEAFYFEFVGQEVEVCPVVA